MHYGQLATAGTALTVAGVVLGQVWLVAGTVGAVAVTALVIRYGFRRGRTPQDL